MNPQARLIGLLLTLSINGVFATDKNLGTLSGKVGYPSEELPAMRIYAFAKDGMSFYVTNTKPKQRTFNIVDIPAGEYYIVAYALEGTTVTGEVGGWSKFVTCGATVQCQDHNLIPVIAVAGKTTAGIDIGDWYAPTETFPPEPTTISRKNSIVNECSGSANLVARDACNFHGYRTANTTLDIAYQRALDRLAKTPACKQHLIDDQNTWLTYRREHCAAPEGVGYKGYVGECLRVTTEQRLAYLNQQTFEKCKP